jgi:hypothetical protein
VHEALAFVEGNITSIDGAVLDVNLHGEKSYPIADALASYQIKFVFATGYGVDFVDGAYRRFPRCEKPINPRTLVVALCG